MRWRPRRPPCWRAQPANRWSVWGAAYGGSATIDGNAVVGSHDTTARAYGVVGGADYKVTPNTLLGFALAGGGTNYSLANAHGPRLVGSVPGRRLRPAQFRPGLSLGGAGLWLA